MGNANIDENLKKKIENLLIKNPELKIRYQNLKGFIDNACLNELEKFSKKQPKDI
jgi:hypothetical protein